jgi:GNAT superfamily N-acetyltransferase
MLALAADWRAESRVRSVAEVLADPSVAHYAAGWSRTGDEGIIAQDADASPVGAAWWRFFTSDAPGYGFVDSDVPEVSIAVLPEHRGQGVGGLLMRQLIKLAQETALSGLSLSVERDNFAMKLYQALAFVEVGGSPDAATMLLSFRA